MARLPDRSSRFILISTVFVCSIILFIDFRFGAFKPVQNFFNSSSIFIQVFSREIFFSPVYNSVSSIWSTKKAKEESENLKQELNNHLIQNYIISNKEILDRNIFFDFTYLEEIESKLIPAKVARFDVNQYLSLIHISEPTRPT